MSAYRHSEGRLHHARRFRLAAMLIAACIASNVTVAKERPAGRSYVPGRVLVKVQEQNVAAASSGQLALDGVQTMRAVSALARGPQRGFVGSAWFSAELKEGVSVTSAIAALAGERAVLAVEPDFIAHATDAGEAHAQATTGDPRAGEQYALDIISAPEAWEIHAGDGQLIVAVIDSGVALGHEDLYPQLWINAAEDVGDELDGIDNDNNGFVDDLVGWNFITSAQYPQGHNNPGDDCGHGSHVAGIIAAVRGNGCGIAGTADVRIMPLKVLDAEGNGPISAAISAVDYAVANGARIINMSLGFQGYSQALAEACTRAAEADVLVIAATGNDGMNQLNYPAAYDSVMAVGASDENDMLADFSNTGSGIDLVAPGVQIVSTVPGGYDTYDGTSMASPYAAGVAALVRSAFPEMSAVQVRARLNGTADDLYGAGYDTLTGYGRVNALRALTEDGEASDPEVPGADDDFEENDTYAQAAILAPGSYELQGLDNDVFWIATGGVHASVEISGPAGDLDLYLIDADQETILARSEEVGSEESVEADIPATGAYIAVLPYNSQTGSYTLTLSLDGEEDDDPLADDDYEENDTVNEASPIELGEYELKGWDADCFALALDEAGELSVSITGPDGDLNLALLDQDRIRIGLSATEHTSDEHVSVHVEAGTCYIVALPHDDAGSPYTLTIAFEASPEPPEDQPDPSPEPDPEPEPEPEPEPAPQPAPEPEPAPEPQPEPQPAPAPAPAPTPEPAPVTDPWTPPSPQPTPSTPAPSPEPIADPVPTPAPAPVLEPTPVLDGPLDPGPQPAPEPEPWYEVEPNLPEMPDPMVAPPLVTPCGFGSGFAVSATLIGLAGLSSQRRRRF